MTLFGDDGGRREKVKKARVEGRLPPGQLLAIKWPVLHAGGVPRFDAASWDFKISGLLKEPLRLTWEEFRTLPQTEVASDFHCVTRWSRLDNRWKGVLFTEVLELVKGKTGAEYVLVLAEEGYTAIVPLKDLERPDVLFAFRARRQAPPGRAWRTRATDCAATVCMEKREMGARVDVAGPR